MSVVLYTAAGLLVAFAVKWLITNEVQHRANRDNLRFYYRKDE